MLQQSHMEFAAQESQAAALCFHDEYKEFLVQETSVMGVQRNCIL
jgi:hypothetical protein